MSVLKYFLLLLIIATWAYADCEHHFVTHQELQQFMGTTQSLTKFVQPLNTMLKENELDCPLQIAAFLAQVRHETNGLQIFLSIDGAGALHMLPADIRVACYDLPEIKASFAEKFVNCTRDSPCDCGTDLEAASVLLVPKYAFDTAAWMFSRGAAILRGPKCANLKQVADQGLGDSVGDVMSGFHLITKCIHGYDNTEALDERIQYYKDALAIVNSWSAEVSQAAQATEDTNKETSNPKITSKTFELSFWQMIAIGIGFFVALVVIITLIIVASRKRRSERV